MKKLKPFLLLSLVAVNSMSCNEKQNKYPTIIIDDNHYNLRAVKNDTVPTQDYNIQASKIIIVDASKYDLSVLRKLNGGKNPDLIQLLCKSGSYVIDLDTTKAITVDEKSAKNIGGNQKFEGLNKGEQAIIGLGTVKMDGNKAEFITYWVAMINVE